MAVFDDLFCTDEYLVERIGKDWSNAAHRLARVAVGTDGVLTSPSRWVLSSSLCDFAARGLVPGHVVRIFKRESPSIDDILAVESAASGSPNTLTVRRVGGLVNEGEPPGPASGVDITGVSFESLSARSSIRNYTRLIRDRYPVGIGPTQTLDDIAASGGPTETIEELCALLTFRWLFYFKAVQAGATTGTRSGGGAGGGDDYWNKSRGLDEDIKGLWAILDARYGGDSTPESSPTITPGIIRINVRGRRSSANELG